jgi:hypothetical protein
MFVPAWPPASYDKVVVKDSTMGSDPLEIALSEKLERSKSEVLVAVFGGLERAVSRAGGDLAGFSIRLRGYEVLMTLRIDMPAGPMIAFVASDSLANVLTKAVRDAESDRLRLRPDQFAKSR